MCHLMKEMLSDINMFSTCTLSVRTHTYEVVVLYSLMKSKYGQVLLLVLV